MRSKARSASVFLCVLFSAIVGAAWAGVTLDGLVDQPAAAGQTVGAGDGRIHIIPTMSAASVKNGGALSIQAVVTAVDGVAKVEARIEKANAQLDFASSRLVSDLLQLPINTIELKPGPATSGGVNADATMGLWQAEWEAHGLEETQYRVAVTVTDKTGHSFTDASLQFSDPVAGNTAVGSATYPDGGMMHMGSSALASHGAIWCGAVDTDANFAVFGTGTSPGTVIKVHLGTSSDPPELEGTLVLESGENDVRCVVMDRVNNYAYFGTHTSPGRVVKVDVGISYASPLTRVTALTLNSGENDLRSAVLDPDNGFAYFGTETSPGRVVKVALGADDDPPARIGAVTLNTGEEWLTSAVIDVGNGYAYFGTNTAPGKVVKVALGAADAPPSRTGAVTCAADETGLHAAVIDPAHGYAYFSTLDSPSKIVKFRLSGFVRLGRLVLNAGENRIMSGVIDADHNFAYFGTDTLPGYVVKVELRTTDAAPARVGAVEVETPYLYAGVIDVEEGYLHFASHTDNLSSIAQVALGSSGAPTRIAALTFATGENQLECAAIDYAHGAAFFGTYTTPGRVVKVRIDVDPPVRLGAVTLNPGEDYLRCAAVDTTHDYVYFGTGTSPGRVVKVAFGATAATLPYRVGAVTLNTGENILRSAVLQVSGSGGYGYFGTQTSPGRVVKVNLGDGSNNPTRLGAVTLNAGENWLGSAVIDTSAGYAYFGTDTSPGIVIQVALGSGSNLPTRENAITLNADEEYLESAVADLANGYAYFGTDTTPGRVVKVQLGEGALFRRVTRRTLNTGEDSLFSATIDTYRGHAYFGTLTTPGRVVKVDLRTGTSPERVGAVTLNAGEDTLHAAVLDPFRGYALFGTSTLPGKAVRIGLGDADPPELVHTGYLPGEMGISAIAVDSTNGYAYLAVNSDPGQVVKVKISNAYAGPERIGSLVFQSHLGEVHPESIFIDPENGYGYVGMMTYPGKILKFNLGSGDNPPTDVATLTLNTGEDDLKSVVADTANGYAWFGTYSNPAYVVKVRLGAGSATPTRLGAVELPVGVEKALYCAVADLAAGYAYFGTSTVPGIVIKVALGTGDALPTRVGSVTLNAGEDQIRCAVIRPEVGCAWFGCATEPGKVVCIELGAGAALPTRSGVLTCQAGEDWLWNAAADGPYLYFTAIGSAPCKIVRVYASGPGNPSRIGAIEHEDVYPMNAFAIDPSTGYGYYAAYPNPGKVLRVALSFRGLMKATTITMPEAGAITDVRFYRHSMPEEGPVRLAIYGPRFPLGTQLIWQSESITTTSSGWLTVPISEGTPTSLSVSTGTYYLAFQVDTPYRVPSYTDPGDNECITLPQAYGEFQDGWSLFILPSPWVRQERWSMYVTYAVPPDGAPSGPGASPIAKSSINWTWNDNSSNETGFKVWADPGAGPPTTLRTTTAADVESWLYSSLTPNTQYAFQVAATNEAGDSAKTTNYARYTYAADPFVTGNVICSKTPSTLYPAGTHFVFSNPAGFGPGTHGGTKYALKDFQYVWDTSATHTWTGGESLWSASTLDIAPGASGSYYLHLRSRNQENIVAGTLDYGPFMIDTVAPMAITIDRLTVSPTNGSTGSFQVTFSETVQNFNAEADVVITQSGVTHSGFSITGAGPYIVNVTGVSGSGSINLKVSTTSDVRDLAGNALASSVTSANLVFDQTAPSATLGSAPDVTAADLGETAYDYTVVYTDNLAINIGTVGASDTIVTGPGGYSQAAAFMSVVPGGNGTPRTATYRIVPPGGSWDALDAGVYTIAQQLNQVYDTAGNVVPAAPLGSFEVQFAKLFTSNRSFWYYRYASPGIVDVTVKLASYSGTNPLTALGFQETIPAAWTFDQVVSASTPLGVTPDPGDIGTLSFAWTTIPALPATVTYRLNVPAGQTGDKTFSGQILFYYVGSDDEHSELIGPLTAIAKRVYHSADYTDVRYVINLTELLRVISYYNVGQYHVQPGSSDGYGSGAGSHDGAPHDSDYSGGAPTWKVELTELLRLIQFYNSGYHVQEGTNDGFAPGP